MPESIVGPSTLPAETLQEKAGALDSIPLFMKSIPEDESDNPTIAALQSLAHEGTPDEVAQNFKERGNEYFKGKRWREAIGFYTQGIDAKPDDPVLKEALLCNRAAANLNLQNFGSVLRDCSAAIKMNAKSSKAHYRSAQALVELERLNEAIDCCTRCLAFDKENRDVKALLEKSQRLKAEKDRKEKEKLERIEKEKQQQKMLRYALRMRNVLIIPNLKKETPPTDDFPIFDPEDPTYKSLIIPVYLEYPQYNTYDMIPQFVEDTPFSAHLVEMFPPKVSAPEWDKKGEYREDNLVVYASTKKRRLFKVGRNMTLRDVCNAAAPKVKATGEKEEDGLELTDGHLTFAVLPRGNYEKQWVQEFKRLRERETGR